MLHRETISDTLFDTLEILSQEPELASFRLVGGTALALQLGHRKSDDLDFFSAGSFDLNAVKQVVNRLPGQATLMAEKPTGLSFVYDPQNNHPEFKIDIYNWGVKFIKPIVENGLVRMASLEDIAAFKLDAICSRKEKKDYVDIAELLEKFSFEQMLSCYREKFPYADPRVVLSEIANTEDIRKSINPFMLNQTTTEKAVLAINTSVKEYAEQLVKRKQESEKLRLENIQKLMEKKSKGQKPPGHSL